MNHSLNKVTFGTFILLLSVFVYACLNYWATEMINSEVNRAGTRFLRGSTIALVFLSIFITLKDFRINVKGIHLICFLWCIIMPFVILYNKGDRPDYFDTILWPLLFESSFLFCLGVQDRISTFRKFFFVVAIYGLFLFFKAVIIVDRQINTIYFSLLTLPWLLLKKKWRIAILTFFTVFIVLSLKRSSLLIILLCWFGYFFTLLKRRNSRIYAIIIIIIISIFWSNIYDQIDVALGGKFKTRVEKEETEEGGRLAIYAVTIEMIRESSIDHLILGHGHYGVFKNSPYKISAHNDFLEVIYDYGLLVFVLYLCLWVYVVKRCVLLFKLKSPLLFPYYVSLSIFLVMSMVSHLVLYNSYFNFLVLFWGAIESVTCFDSKAEV